VLLAGRLCEIVIFAKSKRCEPGDEESLPLSLTKNFGTCHWHTCLLDVSVGAQCVTNEQEGNKLHIGNRCAKLQGGSPFDSG
jgi:hypothetical protein